VCYSDDHGDELAGDGGVVVNDATNRAEHLGAGAVQADESYFTLLDMVGVAILLHRGERIIYANPAMEVLTGYTVAELRDKAFFELAHPQVRKSLRMRGAARLRGETVPDAYEFLIQTKGGEARQVELTARLVELNGMPTVVGSFYDLVARKQAENEQNELRRLLAQIIDGDPVPTFVINAKHETIYWNKACAALTGVSADQVVGTNRQWTPFYPAPRPVMADLVIDGALVEGFEAVYKNSIKYSETIEGAVETEDFFPHFGEGGRWLYFTAAPLHDGNGAIVGAIETLQDVTERRLAELALRDAQAGLENLVAKRTRQLAEANVALERDITRRQQIEAELIERNDELSALNAELSEAREQLIQSEKLASIGQLAAGVAHEINNPIGYVHSNIGTLEGYLGDLFRVLDAYQAVDGALTSCDAEMVRALCKEIDLDFLRHDIPQLMQESKEGISRVKKIVQDLKDFSHVDASQEFVLADLHAGIDSTLNIVANEIKYKADVVKEYGNIPEVECLPSQINQVVMNLCVNAVHAMGPARGTITIRTGCADDKVWIEVADNGSGIPPEVLGRIFDPFFTTKPVGKGTGLGLSLSHGIVQKHGGRLEVDSELGKGTIFRITLPIRHVDECVPGVGK
jgi:PAS domain S-box-containing protein